MNNYNHILSKMGILKTFSISKKIFDADIKMLKTKYSKLKIKNKMSFNDFVKMEIFEQMNEDFEKNRVPGLIVNDCNAGNINHEIMVDLTQFSSLVAKKLIDKKLNKLYHCFVINSLVNILGLTEKDFDNFHKKISDDTEED
jgi:hypothetical protein